ncbi:unnamed protein product [Microthlaspi erraticum]|uniref:Uncharacterized protein n=1 Tax=Microthlaspi erraticum TaxID=1685480 RepID=A0A6D2I563_9BRAS|nr:unnamed protein product [Microthlaspi erraticum]
MSPSLSSRRRLLSSPAVAMVHGYPSPPVSSSVNSGHSSPQPYTRVAKVPKLFFLNFNSYGIENHGACGVKRKNITVGSSVSSRISNNVQRQPPLGENLSTQSRTKAKSFTVSSPFNFISDERAEKRKGSSRS